MYPDDLSDDDIDKVERELDMTYHRDHGRFLSNRHPHELNPDFPTQSDLDDDDTEARWYLEQDD